ncbi:MAG: PIG-L family deacetylase [Vicingaceae bacterium]
MRLFKKTLLSLFAIALLLILAQISYFFYLSPTEEYPEDQYLENANNKTALIVVAHDDDASFFAGTTAKLSKAGWDINFITFYSKQWRANEYDIRKDEMRDVAEYLNFKNLWMHDLRIRHEVDPAGKPWMPMEYKHFEQEFNVDSLYQFISIAILESKPSIILMLDTVMGFYGHNDHTVVGQMTYKAAKTINASEKVVERIYQYVWPPSYAEKVMGGKEVYESAKEIYQIDGMPKPSLEIDISDFAAEKKKTLQLHASQQRNLTKLFWAYSYYPAWLYFGVFDREYFNVIQM